MNEKIIMFYEPNYSRYDISLPHRYKSAFIDTNLNNLGFNHEAILLLYNCQ